MTSFFLKLIGIITMLMDHSGDALVKHFSFLNYFGRLAFPIFAFQATQGYLHTKGLKKYLFRLLVFAFISQAPFMLFLSLFSNEIYLNIFFTLFLGVLTLFLYDKFKNKILGFIIVIVSSMLSEFLKFDYGAFGILLIFEFYFFEHELKDKRINFFNIKLSLKKILMTIGVSFLCFAKYIPNIIKNTSYTNIYLLCGLFTALSLLFILPYNRKTRSKIKIFLLYILSFAFAYFVFYWEMMDKWTVLFPEKNGQQNRPLVRLVRPPCPLGVFCSVPQKIKVPYLFHQLLLMPYFELNHQFL